MSSGDQPDFTSETVATPSERRKHLRFPLSATVEAIEIQSGTKITGRTTDLGLGGCYIDTLSPFSVGSEANVRIVRDAECFEARARVVYSLYGMGMGLAFVSAHPKQIRLFQRWVQEISGHPAPPPQESETAPAERTQTLQNVVLSDLIVTLMQKKVLTEKEGKDLLRRLFV